MLRCKPLFSPSTSIVISIWTPIFEYDRSRIGAFLSLYRAIWKSTQKEPFLSTNTSNLFFLSNTISFLFISIVQKYYPFQGVKLKFYLVSAFFFSLTSLENEMRREKNFKQNAIRFSTFFCLCDDLTLPAILFSALSSSIVLFFIRSISVLIIFLLSLFFHINCFISVEHITAVALANHPYDFLVDFIECCIYHPFSYYNLKYFVLEC